MMSGKASLAMALRQSSAAPQKPAVPFVLKKILDIPPPSILVECDDDMGKEKLCSSSSSSSRVGGERPGAGPGGVSAGGGGAGGGAGGGGVSASLTPAIWERTIPYDGETFHLEYMDLDEFLLENGIPVTVETRTPVTVETRTPVTVETGTPVTVETGTPIPVTVETGTPVTLESGFPVTVKTGTPITVETRTPVPVTVETGTPVDPQVTPGDPGGDPHKKCFSQAVATTTHSAEDAEAVANGTATVAVTMATADDAASAAASTSPPSRPSPRAPPPVGSAQELPQTTTPLLPVKLEEEEEEEEEEEGGGDEEEEEEEEGAEEEEEEEEEEEPAVVKRRKAGRRVVRDPDPEALDPEALEVEVQFQPDPTDLVLSSVPGGALFNPRKHRFSSEELKPQPMIKKARKVYVPDEQKDDKYWSRRKKNNVAAKRSRDARRLKENQITVRASFLERENAALRQQVAELRRDCGRCRSSVARYQARYGPL